MDRQFVEFNAKMEQLWAYETGFFYKLRYGQFDQAGYELLCTLLESCPKQLDSYPLATIRWLCRSRILCIPRKVRMTRQQA